MFLRRFRSRRRRLTLRRALVAAAALAASASLAALPALAPHVEAQPPREADVEAAYLFHFTKFLRVPGRPATDAFTIGVLGRTPLHSSLVRITEHEQVDGRPIHILYVTSPEDARRCDILFISDGEAQRLDHDLDMVGTADVLTVSDAPDFLSHGGMVQFVLSGARVRFSVNLEAVRRTHLQLSSELLKVALSVKGASTEVRQ